MCSIARRVSTATTAGVDVADRQCGADPGDDVIGVVVAVEQQHVAQGAGAGGVTVAAAGEIPELLMLGSESARGAGLGERGCAGQCPGAVPEHFEVVIQVEDLAASMHATNMGRDDGAVDGDGDGLGP